MRRNPLSVVKKESPETSVSPFEDFERRFDEFFRRPFSMIGVPWMQRWSERGDVVSPTVDMYEEGGDVVVKAEIPGMKKEDIEVSITDTTLTISGEKKKEEKVEKKDYIHYERSYGSFARTFQLPSEVHTDQAKASFKDGVLEIRMPKTEEAKQKTRKVLVE